MANRIPTIPHEPTLQICLKLFFLLHEKTKTPSKEQTDKNNKIWYKTRENM